MNDNDKNREEALREHEAGQEAGSKADLFALVVHEIIGQHVSSEEFNAGWDNGAANQPRR
jgi:hypothetical protein